uniref:MyoD family inhibitor domain containing n=1 Tax=Denticeps clupeoides TaxID=299321 RepID=A0A8C4G5Y0_9TELE
KDVKRNTGAEGPDVHQNNLKQASKSSPSPGPAEADHGSSSESITDETCSNEDTLLLPDHVPTLCQKLERGNLTFSQDSASGGRASPCKGRGHQDKKRPPSAGKNQQSFQANADQIQKVAGDDCCVHCVLACLFCEVLSLCSVLAQCLACGPACEALCCCGEGVACGEEACDALVDCGIMEDCCQSSDCLEICLECCSICFTA